jgi:c-di-GMP-binding flagellar brake protein YcgR
MDARLIASIKAADRPNADRRVSPRKICRVGAFFSLHGDAPMRAKTLDLSSNGLGLLLPRALRAGTVGEVSFEIYVDGSLRQIAAKVEVSNCVFLSREVRVGCRFLSLDNGSKKALEDFARWAPF